MALAAALKANIPGKHGASQPACLVQNYFCVTEKLFIIAADKFSYVS